jgi:hypothetical protein
VQMPQGNQRLVWSPPALAWGCWSCTWLLDRWCYSQNWICCYDRCCCSSFRSYHRRRTNGGYGQPDGSHDLHLVGEVLCVAVDFQQVVVRCLQATVEHRKHGQCCFYPVDCCAQVVDLLVHHQQLFVLHVGGHCDDEGVGWGFTV